MEKIDKLDRQILNIISKNARIPFKDVAEECGVSRAAIHQRVQRMIDMNVINDTFAPREGDPADVCFNEILARLDAAEKPERVYEDLMHILKVKVPAEGKGIRYISAQSIRYAYDECPPERRAELKEKIIGYLWDRLD